MRSAKIHKSRRILWLILISSFIYIVTLLIHFIYTSYFNPDFQIIISDQVVFFNRGMGIIQGRIPYRDFYVNAAPLSSYLWAPLVLVSMIGTGDYSTDFVNYENYMNSSSMMILSYSFRIFFAICIILSAVLLYKLEEKRNNKYSFLIALLYCINPFFLHMASFWGSDECIVPLLILLPIYLYERGNKTLANLSIVLGAGLKYFPLLLAPLIWIYSKNWRERFFQSIIFLLGLTAVVLPFYLLSPSEFLLQFQDKITAPGNDGILTVIQEFFSINLENLSRVFPILTMMIIGSVGLILFTRREKWSYHQTVVLLLVYLIFFHKMQISYLAMIIPFLYVGLFSKGSIKILSFLLFLFGVFEGYFATRLIDGT
ncbi:MAG: glycosyltransferase 87 family protein, partial [Candidatus Heimdallarchaeaceae archaeon]